MLEILVVGGAILLVLAICTAAEYTRRRLCPMGYREIE